MFAVLPGHTRPAGHGSQLNTFGAPLRKEKVPAGQLEQETELEIATWIFAVEPAADAEPTENRYVPGAHIDGVTVPGLIQLYPGGHGRQTPDPWEGAKVLLLQL
jgi:hypothetical protein